METRQGSLVPIDRLPGGKLGGGGRWKKYENKSGKTMMGRKISGGNLALLLICSEHFEKLKLLKGTKL